MKYIPYARQHISDEDIQAVVGVLKSEWLTTGPSIENFENMVAKYCGAKYAIAVSNATAALHIACLALDLGPGDYLWTTPNTFVASANCALYCGANVDFVDIDPFTYNISLVHLNNKLIQAKANGRLPKIVVPVHFSGQSCEMEELKNLSEQYGFAILEDASHAIGGSYKCTKVGSCAFSDMTVFSFHPVKIITTGEGGMVVTNDEKLYRRLLKLRSHGIVREQEQMLGEADGIWYYQQRELGFNYRMTDLQAALGISQMSRIEQFIAKRRSIAEKYNQALSDYPLALPYQHPDSQSAWHLYVVKVAKPFQRKSVFDELRRRGIGVNVHYIPVHTQPYYQERFNFAENHCLNAVEYYRDCISLPMFFGLEEDAQNYIIETLGEVLK